MSELIKLDVNVVEEALRKRGWVHADHTLIDWQASGVVPVEATGLTVQTLADETGVYLSPDALLVLAYHHAPYASWEQLTQASENRNAAMTEDGADDAELKCIADIKRMADALASLACLESNPERSIKDTLNMCLLTFDAEHLRNEKEAREAGRLRQRIKELEDAAAAQTKELERLQTNERSLQKLSGARGIQLGKIQEVLLKHSGKDNLSRADLADEADRLLTSHLRTIADQCGDLVSDYAGGQPDASSVTRTPPFWTEMDRRHVLKAWQLCDLGMVTDSEDGTRFAWSVAGHEVEAGESRSLDVAKGHVEVGSQCRPVRPPAEPPKNDEPPPEDAEKGVPIFDWRPLRPGQDGLFMFWSNGPSTEGQKIAEIETLSDGSTFRWSVVGHPFLTGKTKNLGFARDCASLQAKQWWTR